MAVTVAHTLKLPPWLRPLRKAISKAVRRHTEVRARRRKGMKPRCKAMP